MINTSNDECAWCAQDTQPGRRLMCEMCYRFYCFYPARTQLPDKEMCAVYGSPYKYACRACTEGHE